MLGNGYLKRGPGQADICQGPGPQQPLGEKVCVEVNFGTD